jgi:hypothetical protein
MNNSTDAESVLLRMIKSRFPAACLLGRRPAWRGGMFVEGDECMTIVGEDLAVYAEFRPPFGPGGELWPGADLKMRALGIRDRRWELRPTMDEVLSIMVMNSLLEANRDLPVGDEFEALREAAWCRMIWLLDENDDNDSIDFAMSFIRNAKEDEEARMRVMAEKIVRGGSLTPVQDEYSRWRQSRGLMCCNPILKGCTPLRVAQI